MTSFARSLTANANTLVSLIPAVRDGRVEAIHDARVASRRLRAALDIVGQNHAPPRFEEARNVVRRVGRALGRARDVDVSLELLADLERRATPGVHAIAICRLELMRSRVAKRRRMVKQIDALRVDRLPALVSGFVPKVGGVIAVRARQRAHELIDLIERASGVYFPRRAHAARIGIKRLRYLLEFANGDAASDVKVLRKSQQILGDIQDRQVLHDLVAAQRGDNSTADRDLEALLGMLEAESSALYDRFLEYRQDLRLLCEHVVSEGRSGAGRTALVAIAAATAGSVWHLRRRALGESTAH
jgi:CHAD domain-containing protein